MGRTLHEVFRIREVRDHRTGGTVVALNPPDTGSNRDPEIDVLRLVQPIPGGRDPAFSGARVRWMTPFGTTKPCCGESATERPSRWMKNVPLSTKKTRRRYRACANGIRLA